MNITRKILTAALLGAGVWLTCSAIVQDAKPPKPRPKPAPVAPVVPPAQTAPPAQPAPPADPQNAPVTSPATPGDTDASATPTDASAQAATTTSPTAPSTESLKRWQDACTPGAPQKELERFIGKWSTETTVHGMGGPDLKTRGTADFHWLYSGRWLQMLWGGQLMGQQQRGQMTFGYDNFKQKYVCSTVDSIQTMMINSEGGFDTAHTELITYGKVDEPMSGERDKLFKYIWRFDGEDKITYEVHDLSVGETNTLMVDVVFTRKPGS